eukprot:CAMPEP_0116081914 /NCGR_PEP_ID=MMETSP0327-20121206/2456_1 /TAXON_ID=44447 /ORGANISM="Pseudo-nitzschia delicatissima, Strain B596" /LENGTH=510 /DNA_ID=CAMNT_0003572691 /DNA_START=327 /DNA_END=1859 /DNA_ORIENTATION=-
MAVRGFSIVPKTIRVGMNAIPAATTLPVDKSDLICGDKSKTTLIQRTTKTTTTLFAGLFGEQTKAKNQNNTYVSSTSDWQIYVDQSRPSLDRGGEAIFDAFYSLCDTSVDGDNSGDNECIEVQVIPAILPKPASGGKGPWIRCIWNTNNKKNLVRPSPNLDVSNVDSVEKVYRVLTTHLGMTNISVEACECLKLKYKGNIYLESAEIKSAIDAYSEAISVCEEFCVSSSDPKSGGEKSYNSIVLKQQEGLILLLRAKAFLQQAQSHKEALQNAIAEDGTNLPSSEILQSLLSEALSPSSLSFSPESAFSEDPEDGENSDSKNGDTASDGNDKIGETVNVSVREDNVAMESNREDDDEETSPSPSSSAPDLVDEKYEIRENDAQTAVRLSVLRKLQTNGSLRKAQLRKIQYRHGLYQTSLLQATRDSLRATEVLPSYPTAWLRAGELLSDLWKIKESKQYYEKALSIDESLEESMSPFLIELEARQELVDRTRDNKEWPEDSLQLALDVAT